MSIDPQFIIMPLLLWRAIAYPVYHGLLLVLATKAFKWAGRMFFGMFALPSGSNSTTKNMLNRYHALNPQIQARPNTGPLLASHLLIGRFAHSREV